MNPDVIFAEFLGWKPEEACPKNCKEMDYGRPPYLRNCKNWMGSCKYDKLVPTYPDFFGNNADAQRGIETLAYKGFVVDTSTMPPIKNREGLCVKLHIGIIDPINSPWKADWLLEGGICTDLYLALKDAVVEQVPWECACGWKGFPSEQNANSSGHKVCPDCGGSGGLVYRYPQQQPWRIKPALKEKKP